MAIRITCPACKTSQTVGDDKRGRKVRCSECDKPISIPGASSAAIQDRPRVTAKASGRKSDDSDDGDARTPAKKKAAAKSGMGLLIVGGIAAVVLLPLCIGGIGLLGFGFFRASRDVPQQQEDAAQAANKNPPPLVKDDDRKEPKPDPGPKKKPDLGKELPDKLPLDAVPRGKEATVYLKVTMGNGLGSEGSGFFAIEPGVVITNAHVLGMLLPSAPPPRDVLVTVNSGDKKIERTMVGRVLGVDRASDLAVIRVDEGNLPAPLSLETERELVETQSVYISGFPFGSELGKGITVSNSSVSRLPKDNFGALEQIQLGGGANPGNSGGPVINTAGNVVGVLVSGIKGAGINFAIPAEKVRMIMDGRLAETKLGEAFTQGGRGHLPVACNCLDPLNRIRELRVEVWAGTPGPTRPPTREKPDPMAGDGPRQTYPVLYQKGVGLFDVPLPPLEAGQVYWVQPVLTTAKGAHWGPALPTPVGMALLERKPANLTVSLTTEKERTARVNSKFTVTLSIGKKSTVATEETLAELLEVVQTPEEKDGKKTAQIKTAFGELAISLGRDGKPTPVLNQQQAMGAVRTMPPVFVIDDSNATASYIKVSLKQGPLKDVVDELNGMVHNPFEATQFKMPNRMVQPLEKFQSRSTMMLRTANAQGPNRRATIVDLNLACTHQGIRKRNGRDEAVITVAGHLDGRFELKGKVGGLVSGKLAFDIAGGFVSSAQIKIVADNEEQVPGLGAIQQSMAQDIDLERSAGNPKSLALGKDKGGTVTNPGPIVANGKILLNINNALTNNDLFDPAAKGLAVRMKVFPLILQAGKTYVISMNSRVFDTYLRLVDPAGRQVAEDDDSGGDLNARIIYRPVQTGSHRVVATSYTENVTGPFQLIVQEQGEAGALPKGGKDLPVGPKGGGAFTKPGKSKALTSYLNLDSSKGDYIGQGQSYAYPGDKVNAKIGPRGLQLSCAGWTLFAAAPGGAPLDVGEYPNAQRSPSPTAPGLDFFGQGRGSNMVAGEFVIWEIETQGDQVVRLAFDFVQRSEGKGPPLVGKIRINSTFE